MVIFNSNLRDALISMVRSTDQHIHTTAPKMKREDGTLCCDSAEPKKLSNKTENQKKDAEHELNSIRAKKFTSLWRDH